MTIKTADRLAELRKARGLSQEELAEQLGVTRQAVSKWERAESAPDTDNLIELAKIYGVTLDELINGETPKADGEEDVSEAPTTTTTTKSGAGWHYLNALYPAFTIIIAIAYLLLGCFIPNGKGWACYWFLFILIPVFGSIVTVIRTKRAAHFNYPCLVTAIFCAVGMLTGIWHPTWVLFVTIPVFYIIANAFEKSDKNEK